MLNLLLCQYNIFKYEDTGDYNIIIISRLWWAGLSFNQGVGGSIPALVDVLSKTLHPELLPVAETTVYECHMIASRFG